MAFPEHGRPADDILRDLRALKVGDVHWQGGRSPAFVFKASDAVETLGRDAFVEYFTENALGAGSAFPSVRQLEQQVVAMALSLLHAPEGAAGFMSTGGSESILLAVQACRRSERQRRGNPQHRGNIVAPETLHPAFDKAAELMDLPIRRVPVGADLRADVAAMAAAVDDDTILLVGSAPSFPYGMVDPIAELSRIALDRGVWLHVDACVGGYLAPFARQLGRPAGQVITGVHGREGAGGGGVIGLLALEGAIAAADPVQLQGQGPGAADAGSRQVLGIEIPAQVAVEFPVGRLARIAIAGTPNRQGGLAIAAEEGHAGGGADRRIHPIAGPGQAMEQAVAIEHGVAQAAGHEQLVEAFVVGTFRQPDPLGAHPQ